MNSPSSAAATPPLPSSPATLTSTRISVSGAAVTPELLEHRVGGDRVDQPHQRQDPLHLAALQVADEVPGEGARRSARAWPPGPGAGSRRRARSRPRRARSSSSASTYLVAARISTPGPQRSRTRSRLRRTVAGSMSRIGSGIDPGEAALAPGAPGVAPVGEEQLRVAARAEVARLDRLDPGRGEQPARDLRQVEHPPGGDPVAEPARSARGPRRRPRSSRGRSPGPIAAARAPTSPTPRSTIPAASPRQPQWSIATPALAGERHRQAVGDLDQRRQSSGSRSPGRRRRPGARPRPRTGSAAARARAARPRRRGPGSRTGRPRDRGRAPRRGGRGWCAPRPRRRRCSRPRLSDSNAPSLAPPSRVENAARAPGSSASSQRTPSRSRQSIAPRLGARRLDGDPELVLAARRLAVELRPQRRGEPAADRRALVDPGGDQVVAGDLPGARRATARRSRRATRRRPARARARSTAVRPRAAATASDGRAGCARSSDRDLRPRPADGREHRVGPVDDLRPRRGGRAARTTRSIRAPAPGVERTRPHSSSSSNPRRGSSSAASLPQLGDDAVAGDRAEVGRAQELERLGLELEPEPGRVAGGRAGPGSGRRRTSRSCRTRSRPARRSSTPPWGSTSARGVGERDGERVDGEVAPGRGPRRGSPGAPRAAPRDAA